MRLKRKFFDRNTIIVAKELLGKYLCRRVRGKNIRAKITETEAYCGPKDKASHASRGLTPRTRIMFGRPGHAYVYMIYGVYYCLNVVTEKEGYPAAVLVRTAEILNRKSQILNKSKPQNSNFKNKKLNGPGILCRELRIDTKLNGTDLITNNDLWLEDSGEKISRSKIKRGKRIGVDYAGKWKDKLWRFYLE